MGHGIKAQREVTDHPGQKFGLLKNQAGTKRVQRYVTEAFHLHGLNWAKDHQMD